MISLRNATYAALGLAAVGVAYYAYTTEENENLLMTQLVNPIKDFVSSFLKGLTSPSNPKGANNLNTYLELQRDFTVLSHDVLDKKKEIKALTNTVASLTKANAELSTTISSLMQTVSTLSTAAARKFSCGAAISLAERITELATGIPTEISK